MPSKEKLNEIILKWSVFAGLADVTPIPGADLAAVTTCQLKMFYELAEQYEVSVTKERFMELLGTFAVGAGGWGLTILGATTMIKMFPGIGTALLSWQPPMVAAFTWAMGQVLNLNPA